LDRFIQREKKMQQPNSIRQKSGSKAIALDNRILLTKIRLLQLLAVLLSATFALGLRLIFAH
jgi:hypothetical protein